MGTISFRFILYLVHDLVGMMSCDPIIFCRLGLKNKQVIAILGFLSKWLITQRLLHM